MTDRLGLVGAPLAEGFGLVARCAAAGPAMGAPSGDGPAAPVPGAGADPVPAQTRAGAPARWAGLAMAVGFPACALLGLLVQMQFEVIPLHDPTQGWGEHIWNTYGRTIVDCELEAMRTDTVVECPLPVQP